MDTTTVISNDQNVLQPEIAAASQPNSAIAMLTPDSLRHFDKQAQTEIVRIADQIDPLQIEKIMAYGQIPLLRTYESAGKILKAVEGTPVDQEVMQQVIDLSKQANKNQEELNIALQEPNMIQKLFLKVFSSAQKQANEVKIKAITSYRLLTQLSESCKSWLTMLQEGYVLTAQSIEDDMTNGIELEKYIVAGLIAQQRLDGEVEQKRLKAEESGLISDKAEYEALKEGLDAFKVVLLNLQKSWGAYGISIGQLHMQREANKNLQISVRTQMTNSMALAGQQLRNAILDAQNKAAAEGQKSISALNGELMKKISSNTVLTAEESEKLLLNGVYSIESALTAAKTVVDGCNAIRKAREDRTHNIGLELDKLKALVDEISPFISSMREETQSHSGTTSTTSNSGLVF